MSEKARQVAEQSLQILLPKLDTAALAGKSVFITGGTGFFGYWLLTTLSLLNRQGADIRVTVLSRDPRRFLAAQPHLRDLRWLSFVQGNVRDFVFPLSHYDLFIHGATDIAASVHISPMQIADDIVLGSRRILDFAVESGAESVLLLSSGAVYGPQPDGLTHIPEDSCAACPTDLPASAYGEGKRFMEILGTLYAKEHGLRVISPRCFAFVGPGLPLAAHFAIGNFIRDALQADEITVNGDGAPVRSYLYGGDLAIWLLALLVGGDSGRIYNVGSDVPITVRDLAYLIRDTLAPGKPVRILGQPREGSRSNSYVPDIRRARNELGLDVWTSLRDAILLTAEAAESPAAQ